MRVEKITVGQLLTNTYIVSNDTEDAIIIDPGMGLSKVVQNIESRYNVVGIFITHGHIDHIYSIADFSKNIPIYISKEDEPSLFGDKKALYEMFGVKFNLDIEKDRIINICDNQEITTSNIKILPISTPGHTDGSYSFIIDNCLFSGDTIFKSSYGRTDFLSGSTNDLIKSIKHIFMYKQKVKIIYPGHGQNTTIEEEISNYK